MKVFVITVVLFLIGCSPSLDEQVAELVDGKNKWMSYSNGHDYQYVMLKRCFCEYNNKEIKISVSKQKVISAKIDDELISLKHLKSIRGWFDFILKALGHQEHTDNFKIHVEYHPEHGYPVKIYTDIYAMDGQATTLIKSVTLQ